jgi:hypothetical protein
MVVRTDKIRIIGQSGPAPLIGQILFALILESGTPGDPQLLKIAQPFFCRQVSPFIPVISFTEGVQYKDHRHPDDVDD